MGLYGENCRIQNPLRQDNPSMESLRERHSSRLLGPTSDLPLADSEPMSYIEQVSTEDAGLKQLSLH